MSDFDNPTTIQHCHFVKIQQSVNSMRGHNTRAVMKQLPDHILHFGIGLGIQTTLKSDASE